MKIFLLICIFTLLSCAKEKERRSVSEDFRRHSLEGKCSGVNFHNGVFLKKNVLKFFECTGYSKDFPLLYSKLGEVSDKGYDSFNQAMDRAYYSEDRQENVFFSRLIKEMRKETIDSLEVITKILFNGPEGLKELSFWMSAQDSNASAPRKHLLHDLVLLSQTVTQRVDLKRLELIRGMGPELHKALMELFASLLRADNFSLYQEVLKHQDLIREVMGRVDASQLTRLQSFFQRRDNFFQNLDRVESLIRSTEGSSCKSSAGNLQLDIAGELLRQVQKLATLPKEQYLRQLVDLATKAKFFEQLCPTNPLNGPIRSLLLDLTELLDINGFYEILSLVAKVEINTGAEFLLFELPRSEFTQTMLSFLDLSSLDEKEKFLSFVWTALLEVFQLPAQSLASVELSTQGVDSKGALRLSFAELLMSDQRIAPACKFFEKLFPEDGLSALFNALWEEGPLGFSPPSEDFSQELKRFLSKEHLLKFLGLFAASKPSEKIESFEVKAPVSLAARPPSLAVKCLEDINQDKFKQLNSLIKSFPASCKENQEGSFVIKLLTGLQQFSLEIEEDLAEEVSLLSPGVLSSLTHELYKLVQGKTAKQLEERLGKLQSYFLNPIRQAEFAGALRLYNENEKLQLGLKKLLEKTDAENLQADLGLVIKSFRLLSRSNEKFDCSKCLIKPERIQSKLKSYGLNLKEKDLLEILNDLADEQLNLSQLVSFFKFLGTKSEDGILRAAKLQAIIKEVSFIENFYVIYFFNKLAQGENYVKTLETLKKDFALADTFAGIFSTVRVFPRDAKARFARALSHFDVLEDFKQNLPGESLSYGELLIKIAKVMQKNSPAKTRRTPKFGWPRIKKVHGHLAQSFAVLGEENILVNLSRFIKESAIQVPPVSFKHPFWSGVLKANLQLGELSFSDFALGTDFYEFTQKMNAARLDRLENYLELLHALERPLLIGRSMSLDFFYELVDSVEASGNTHLLVIQQLKYLIAQRPLYVEKIVGRLLRKEQGYTYLQSVLEQLFAENWPQFLSFMEELRVLAKN